MRIAIISDVHGNLEALKSTLKDIQDRGIETIYCLGDITAKGTHQQECLDLLRDKCEVMIQGNCDEYYTRKLDYSDFSEIQIKRNIWNNGKLNDESKEYLRNLPFCHEFYMSGRLIRLVHAHPQAIDKFAGNIDQLERLYELLLPSEHTISQEKADVLIYGHIHTPYLQKIYNRYIVNCGSVGNAIDVFRNDEKDGDVRNTVVSNYLIINGELNSHNFDDPISFELVSVPYDIEKELADNTDNVEFDSYALELREGKYRDMNKIYDSFSLRGIDKDQI